MKMFALIFGFLVLIFFSACGDKSANTESTTQEPNTNEPSDQPLTNEPFTGIPDDLVIKKDIFKAYDVHLVTKINTPKTVVLAEKRSIYTLTSQPSHGTITGTMPTLTYTPEQDYHGTDSVTYTKTQGEKSDTATIMIYVYNKKTDVNDIVANDINMTLDTNQSSLQGDWSTLSNTQATKATVVSQGNFGSFSIEGNQLTYTKQRESKEIDTAVLELEQNGVTKEILVNIEALYWKQLDGTTYSDALAIKSDGTLWWLRPNKDSMQERSHATNWKQTSIGYSSMKSAIKEDGTLWVFGYDNDTKEYMVARQEPTMATDWKSVKAGYQHLVTLKNDGTIWSHGNNQSGTMGDGTFDRHYNSDQYWFQENTQATDWVNITAGYGFSMALKSDGTLWGWGRNPFGQIGNGTKISQNTPQQEVTLATNWRSISSGDHYGVALKTDGTLWSWGINNMTKDENGTYERHHTPIQELTLATDWAKVSSGTYHTIALKTDGTLWSWGPNKEGQLGDGTTIQQDTMVQEATQSHRWVDIAGNGHATFGLKEDGSLWSWGQYTRNGRDHIKIAKQEITKTNNWKSVCIARGFSTIGTGYTVALKEDGTLWSWGSNRYGQLGNGTKNTQQRPVQESTHATNWKEMISKSAYTMAIKEDGTLWFWGNLDQKSVSNPIQESSNATNWERFEGNSAIKEDKSIWKLDSKNSENNIPLLTQQEVPILDWKEIFAISSTRHVIKEDGTLWSWGNNAGYGMFGTGDTNSSDTPVQEITKANDWAKIYRGSYHILALKDDGTLWGWGANFSGQLGDGTKTDNYTPTEEKSLSIWTDVMTGYNDSIGLRVDGTIWTWGSARYSDDETLLLPKQEPSLANNWKTLAKGSYPSYIMAIKEDGTLWGWGDNGASQIYPLYYAPQRAEKRVP